ncbi:MAG: hypothetical protein JRF33_04850 [Deltaproteobacteria bacterium]|nr:hypothetical protein [Deltaproteobacteria bacterium]
MKKILLIVSVVLLAGLGIFAAACGADVCDEEGAANCGATYNTCLTGCVADETCQQDCTTTYCNCLDDTNCSDTTGECD